MPRGCLLTLLAKEPGNSLSITSHSKQVWDPVGLTPKPGRDRARVTGNAATVLTPGPSVPVSDSLPGLFISMGDPAALNAQAHCPPQQGRHRVSAGTGCYPVPGDNFSCRDAQLAFALQAGSLVSDHTVVP